MVFVCNEVEALASDDAAFDEMVWVEAAPVSLGASVFRMEIDMASVAVKVSGSNTLLGRIPGSRGIRKATKIEGEAYTAYNGGTIEDETEEGHTSVRRLYLTGWAAAVAR